MGYPILQEQEYLKLIDGAELVKRTRTKIRLLLSAENKIIKHIYKRNFFSTSTIWPYATRFIKNAHYLKSKNIVVPEINAVYFYPKLNCDIILYDYVDGKTLYQLARDNDLSFFPKLMHYVAHLHLLGIEFKDIHLGNIVFKDDAFTLLDLESIRYQRGPLNVKQRARNMACLFSRKEDTPLYRQFGLDRCLSSYFELASLPDRLVAKTGRLIHSRVSREVTLPS